MTTGLEIYRQLLDIWETAPRLRIKTKEGPRAHFHLRPQQVKLLEALLSGEDVLALKPRQIGASTLIAYYLFWTWFTSPDPITIVILSYKKTSSKNLLRMVRQFYDSLPDSLKRDLAVDNTEAMRLEDSEAELLAVGARDDGGTRSFTAHYIWLSEFAFMDNAEELVASTEGSITEGGQVIAESTANYWNDAMHLEIQKAKRGEADWRYIFFPWNEHPEYVRDLGASVLSVEEQKLAEEHSLSPEQLMWRRRKVGKLGEDKFKREYPLSISDAYTQSDGAFFSEGDLAQLAVVDSAPVGTTIIAEPKEGHLYTAGFDPGGGVGLDNSSLTIYDATDGAIVARWRKNRHTFDDALETVGALALRYRAWLCIEYNNHGHGYHEAYRSLGAVPGLKLHLKGGKPFFTDFKTKRLLWTHCKKSIQDGDVTVVDGQTYSDLRQLSVDELGRVVLPRTAGGHCDDAMSLALALWAAKGRRIRRMSRVDEFIAQERIRSIQSRGGASLTMAGLENTPAQ